MYSYMLLYIIYCFILYISFAPPTHLTVDHQVLLLLLLNLTSGGPGAADPPDVAAAAVVVDLVLVVVVVVCRTFFRVKVPTLVVEVALSPL